MARESERGSARRRIIKITALLLVCLMILSVAPVAFAVSRYEVLMIGDKDQYVLELQRALHSQGYLSQSPTGYFGTDTQKALLEFQKSHGLTADGKAGPQTRRALLGSAYTTIPASRLTDDTGSGLYGSVDDDVMGKLISGSEGPEVVKLQNRLKVLGYYTYAKITGYYGPVTKDAVERFQRDNGLAVDGIAGTQTQKKLYATTAERSYLMLGDKSDEVTRLQARLKKLGYFSGNATGYFGTLTDNAVRRFQQVNGLAADGKVGAKTKNLLFSDNAKPATGGGADLYGDTDGATADDFVALALQQEGKPCVYSTEGPNSFDCSGLAYYCLKNCGVNVSRMSSASYANYSAWTKISSMSALKKGDLLFFNSGSSSAVNYMGIYLGSGKMIHAASTSGKVVVTSCTTSAWSERFAGARRVFSEARSSNTDSAAALDDAVIEEAVDTEA